MSLKISTDQVTPAQAGPSTSQPLNSTAKSANRQRNQANNRKFGTALPILLPTSPLHPSRLNPITSNPSKEKTSLLTSFLHSSLTSSARDTAIEVPICHGVYDEATQSVWVVRRDDIDILFQRGFFGKGTLSRSEPSWRERRIGLLKGGDTLAAEQMREARRIARKQFKIDRARAFLDAAKAAEAVLTTGVTPHTGASSNSKDSPSNPLYSPTLSATTTGTTDYTSLLPPGTTSLTPQTFLVRRERPDMNRNRGKKAFKPRSPGNTQSSISATGTEPPATTVESTGRDIVVPTKNIETTTDQPVLISNPPNPVLITSTTDTPTLEANLENLELNDEDDEDVFDESAVEEMEHLQLGLEEAFFLSAGLGVLKVYDPASKTYPPPGPALLSLFLTSTASLKTITPVFQKILLPDDPFLVSYVAYHHFRSLGWVVKPGIKFCTDWLLYKRGPVFSHSLFSCVLVPVYSDPRDRKTSPFSETDWYTERTSWKWMNTIMRVNSLVQKVVIIVYITIPSLDSFSSSSKLSNGTLNPQKNDIKSLLSRYSVREVVLSRFGPARRRD